MKLKEIKSLGIVAVMLVVGIAHDKALAGADLPQNLQELENIKTEFRTDIDNLEQHVNEHIDNVHGLAGKSLEEFVQSVVDSNMGASLTQTIEDFNELKIQMESIISNNKHSVGGWIGGSIAGGITGAFAGLIAGLISHFIGPNRRILSNVDPEHASPSKNTANLSPQDPTVGTSFVGPIRPTEKTNDKDNESSIESRVVTQTTKEQGTNRILVLHNPSTEWSPRTAEEAIADILNERISYVSRGPKGNEAEIEVRYTRDNVPYLRTKPDEHGGNNLAELPDPT